MIFGDTIVLEEHSTEEKLAARNDLPPRQLRQTYYGYAFESFCTASTPRPEDDPDRKAGWGGDVNTNVQWCSVVKTKIGNTRLLIGGEVDCVRGRYTGQPDTFVELKTSMTIRGPQDDERFERKLLKFYFQSFLLGVPEIVVGFRTPQGRLTTMQSFQTTSLPRLVRGKPGAWDPSVGLAWGDQFFAFLFDTIGQLQKDKVKNHPVWRINFGSPADPSGIEIYQLDEEDMAEVRGSDGDRVGFIPRDLCDELAQGL